MKNKLTEDQKDLYLHLRQDWMDQAVSVGRYNIQGFYKYVADHHPDHIDELEDLEHLVNQNYGVMDQVCLYPKGGRD